MIVLDDDDEQGIAKKKIIPIEPFNLRQEMDEGYLVLPLFHSQ
jgi:hypothetical protein